MKIGVLTLFPISELLAHHLKRSVSFATLNSTGTSVCLILQIISGLAGRSILAGRPSLFLDTCMIMAVSQQKIMHTA